MSSKVPVYRPRSGKAVFIHCTLIVLVLVLSYTIHGDADFFTYYAAAYVSLSILLRYVVPLSHRAGMKLMQDGHYEQAKQQFRESMAFFEKHQWIDKYRYLVLLSSSAMSYREADLNNIAYSDLQLGNIREAKEMYLKLLGEYPENILARNALTLIDNIKAAANEPSAL